MVSVLINDGKCGHDDMNYYYDHEQWRVYIYTVVEVVLHEPGKPTVTKHEYEDCHRAF